jgi:hypothetical protein
MTLFGLPRQCRLRVKADVEQRRQPGCICRIQHGVTRDMFIRYLILPGHQPDIVGLVEDLMGAIVYLGSDASAPVTGTSLIMDGG